VPGLSPLLNSVEQYTNAAGTGTLTLGALVNPNALTMVQAGAVTGQPYTYRLDAATGDFEIGRGTWTTPTTFTRDVVLVSVISGTPGTSKISAASTTTFRIVAAAEDMITRQQALSRGWLIGG
jgi:hypothetical protein